MVWDEEFNSLAKANEDRIAKLEADVEALKPDAERYRFLRDRWPESIHVRDMVTKMRLTEDYLDGAIDTAMDYERK
jgi:hypothetical protein